MKYRIQSSVCAQPPRNLHRFARAVAWCARGILALGFLASPPGLPCGSVVAAPGLDGGLLLASREPHFLDEPRLSATNLLQDPALPVITNLPPPSANPRSPRSPQAGPVRDGIADALPAWLTNLNIEPLTNANLITPTKKQDATEEADRIRTLQVNLEVARHQRIERDTKQASRILVGLLQTNAPPELKRAALFELALVAQDEGLPARAQQILAQYARLFPQDPSIPEILLRQGLLYRQMGANGLAVAKFYSVMTAALSLKLERMEYYQRLVLQAQTEIADTYYLEGKVGEAADFLARLLKLDSPQINKAQVRFKLIRCLGVLGRHGEVILHSQAYLERHPDTPELAEVRFLLASSFRQLGRSHEALKQVELLLRSQKESARQFPEQWIYWQKRAGNEFANQLYREGDYLGTLEIYEKLADLDSSPAWQLPVWYQIGLVFERLQQPVKAAEVYSKVVDRQAELTGDKATPALQTVVEMARWRREQIGWLDKAAAAAKGIQ